MLVVDTVQCFVVSVPGFVHEKRGAMKSRTVKFLLYACAASAVPSAAHAANPQPMTINYSVSARAKISVTPSTINFPDSNPVLVPQVSATENPVQVTVKFRKDPSAAVTATLIAQGGPLTSGGNTIASSNITWTASGSGFVGGTLSSSTPQAVGSWSASGAYTGNLTFRLNNLWTYATGTYTGSITYTVTAP